MAGRRTKSLILTCLVALGVAGALSAGYRFIRSTGGYLLWRGDLPVSMFPGAVEDEAASRQWRRGSTGVFTEGMARLFSRSRMGVFRVPRPASADPRRFQQEVVDFFSRQAACRELPYVAKGGSRFVECHVGTDSLRIQVLDQRECCGLDVDAEVARAAPKSQTLYVFR